MIVGHLSVCNDNGVTYADLLAAMSVLDSSPDIEPMTIGRIQADRLAVGDAVSEIRLPYRSRIDERS